MQCKPSRVRKNLRLGRTIAILIDESGVQMAAVKDGLFGKRLLGCNKSYVLRNPIAPDAYHNSILNEINAFIQEYRGPVTRYLMGVIGSETTFRKISLPPLPKSEIGQAVYWEGNKRIPFGLDNACYGYYIDRKFKEQELDSFDISLIAVPQSEIERKLEMTRPLGIEFSAVWHEQEAIGQLLRCIPGFDLEKTYALINVSRNASQISYYRGSRLEFMHSTALGTDNLGETSARPLTHEQFLEELAAEVQNSLDFYAAQYSSNFTSDIYIYGDLSYSDELIEKLTGNIGLNFALFPTEFWSNKANADSATAEQVPVCLGAVAIAMADFESINFLPEPIKEKRKARRFYHLAVPVLVLFTGLVLTYWHSIRMENDALVLQLNSSQDQIERFKRSESYQTYNRLKRQLAADKAFLARLQKDPTHLYLNLKELSRIVPDKIRLESYELFPGPVTNKLNLAGKAVSSDPPPEIILAEFIAELETSPFYNNVRLSKHIKRPKGKYFEIDFTIDLDAVI